MSDVTRSMAQRLGTMGVAMALVLGGAGLAGCGGSSAESASEATEADATEEAEPEEAEAVEEEVEEDQIKQWFQTSYSNISRNENESWVNPGTTNVSTNEDDMVYEVDDKGNVTKSTTTSHYTSEGYESETETVTEYTRDENGWPLTAEITRTTRSYSVSYEEVEDYDEDGQLVVSMRPVEDGGSFETAEPVVETTTETYTYEYDDEGRVTKGVCDNNSRGSIELTYHDNGKVATAKQTYSYERYTGDGDETETVTYSYGTAYNEKGDEIEYSDATMTDSGSTETVMTLDDDGAPVSEVTTVTDADGTKHELTKSYENEKDADGNVTKSVCTVSGDGEATKERWVDNGNTRLLESFGKDGSVIVSEVTYDEMYNDVIGEPTTYDGPYSTYEATFDKDGNVLTSTTTYYDGTIMKNSNTYDKDGNLTKYTNESSDGTTTTTENTFDKDGNQISTKRTTDGEETSSNSSEWVFVEEPSEYAGIYRSYTMW